MVKKKNNKKGKKSMASVKKVKISEKTPTKPQESDEIPVKDAGNGKSWRDQQACNDWSDAKGAILNQLVAHTTSLIQEGIPPGVIFHVYKDYILEFYATFLEVESQGKKVMLQ